MCRLFFLTQCVVEVCVNEFPRQVVGVVIAFLVEEVKRYDTKPVDCSLFAVVIVKNAIESTKSLYDLVVVDSEGVEMDFAKKLESEDIVAVYTKLPRGFYISTPMGKYNPDWAIAFKEGTVKHVYFVAETKGSLDSSQLRTAEQGKIDCAKKHFESISSSDVVYEVVNTYQDLYNKVTE